MPLWVGGLALSILFLGALGLPLSGEAFEWAEYLMLGTLFPALAIAIAVRRARRRVRDLAVGSLQTVAATVCLLAGFTFLVRHASPALLALAAATWALGVLLSRRGAGRAQAPMTRAELLAGLVLVTLSWTVSSRLTSWAPFLTVVSALRYTLVVLVGGSLLATAALRRFPSSGFGDLVLV